MELDAPSIGVDEEKVVVEALRSGFVSSVGPLVPEFEAAIAARLNAKGAVAVQSGTAALHLALHALGIGPGDEVILPSLTFIATVNAVLYVGARPIIVDVDPITWCIDPVEVEIAITSKTKAIIPVHLYGVPCDMDKLRKIANAYNLYLIEDATEALGARFGGRFAGTIGDLGCLSFNGNKMITTGLGGMILGNDEKRIDRIRHLANQAKVDGPEYIHEEIGFNYRMTNIEAAIGLAQLKRLETFINKKILFRSTYREILDDVVTFQGHYNESLPVWWLTAIKLPAGTNVHYIQEQMMVHGIPTRRIFFPLDRQKYLQKFVTKPCKVAHAIYKHGIWLPSSTVNSKDDVHFAANSLKKILIGRSWHEF